LPCRWQASGGSTALPGPHEIDAEQLRATLLAIRDRGAKAGLALRPDTKLEEVAAALELVDVLLVMTVYPGFSGQAFLSGSWRQVTRPDGTIVFDREPVTLTPL